MWKKENDVGTQPTPTMATYSEAMDKFTKSATAFMEHVHHLTQPRDAYQEAMTVSTAIRNSSDAGRLAALASDRSPFAITHADTAPSTSPPHSTTPTRCPQRASRSFRGAAAAAAPAPSATVCGSVKIARIASSFSLSVTCTMRG